MALTFIKSATAAGSPATISFVDGSSDVVFDNTYNEYQFHFVNIHAGTDNAAFGFQVNSTNDPGGDYDTSEISSTFFKAEHSEGGSGGSRGYHTASDQGNGVALQRMSYSQQMDDDEAFSGVLTIYAPSSSTYVKHFVAKGNYVHHSSHYSQNTYVAGYINDTYPIDEIRFAMDSGNIDSGTIHMYGVG